MRTLSTLIAAGVIALLGVTDPAVAQRVELGLTGGYNLTDWALDVDNLTIPLDPSGESAVTFEPDAHHTFSFGGFGVLELTPAVALQFETLYTRRGIAFREAAVVDDDPVVVDAMYETSYVQMPLLVRVSRPATDGLVPFVMAGPAVAFEWGSWFKGTLRSGNGSSAFDQDDEGFKSRDFGVVAGAGGAWRYNGGTIYLNVRYDLGLNSIVDSLDDGDSVPSVKNRALGVLVGFATQIGG